MEVAENPGVPPGNTHPDAADDPAVQIPADIKAALKPGQVARLTRLLSPRNSRPAFAYQVSTSVFGRKFYLALLSGAEQRTPSRLAQEGQVRSFPGLLLRGWLVFCFASGLVVLLLAGLAVGLYLAKSFLAIDLFDGPSFMHRFFFP